MTDRSSQTSPLPAEARVMELIFASKISQAIAVVARLRVADLLTLASKTVDELAQCAPPLLRGGLKLQSYVLPKRSA